MWTSLINVIFFVAMLGLSIGGCGVLSSPSSEAVEITFGRVLFDCYYVNFAWGYTLSGYFIDQEGEVIRYDRGDDPWQPESLQTEPFVFSSADLEMKYKNRSRVGEVAPDLLQEKLALAGRAAAGEISQEQVAADAGWSGCVLYQYHPDLDGYSEIPLGAGGDFLIRNSAPEAQELLSWLQGLDTSP